MKKKTKILAVVFVASVVALAAIIFFRSTLFDNVGPGCLPSVKGEIVHFEDLSNFEIIVNESNDCYGDGFNVGDKVLVENAESCCEAIDDEVVEINDLSEGDTVHIMYSEKENNTITSVRAVERITPEIEYPFALYEGFLSNSSQAVVNELNSNPIDEAYYKEYTRCKSEIEEQKVLADWSKAYESELKNARAVFEKAVSQKNTESNVSADEVLKAVDDYIESCSDYSESTAALAYSFEEFNLGTGTGHVYDLLLNSLELNRMNTLRLIECINMLGVDYTWVEG
ncbi:MAG: hypothetical protein ACI4IK_05405 [Eubacterium sp.]